MNGMQKLHFGNTCFVWPSHSFWLNVVFYSRRYYIFGCEFSFFFFSFCHFVVCVIRHKVSNMTWHMKVRCKSEWTRQIFYSFELATNQCVMRCIGERIDIVMRTNDDWKCVTVRQLRNEFWKSHLHRSSIFFFVRFVSRTILINLSCVRIAITHTNTNTYAPSHVGVYLLIATSINQWNSRWFVTVFLGI